MAGKTMLFFPRRIYYPLVRGPYWGGGTPSPVTGPVHSPVPGPGVCPSQGRTGDNP